MERLNFGKFIFLALHSNQKLRVHDRVNGTFLEVHISECYVFSTSKCVWINYLRKYKNLWNLIFSFGLGSNGPVKPPGWPVWFPGEFLIGIYNMKRSYNAYFAPLFDKEKKWKIWMSSFEKAQTGKPLASLCFLKRSWPQGKTVYITKSLSKSTI